MKAPESLEELQCFMELVSVKVFDSVPREVVHQAIQELQGAIQDIRMVDTGLTACQRLVGILLIQGIEEHLKTVTVPNLVTIKEAWVEP